MKFKNHCCPWCNSIHSSMYSVYGIEDIICYTCGFRIAAIITDKRECKINEYVNKFYIKTYRDSTYLYQKVLIPHDENIYTMKELEKFLQLRAFI